MINDTIAEIYHIKDCVFGKEKSTFGTTLKNEEPISEEEKQRLEMYGYYTRKALLDKLRKIEEDNFVQAVCIG